MNKIPGHHPMPLSANIETHLQKNEKAFDVLESQIF